MSPETQSNQPEKTLEEKRAEVTIREVEALRSIQYPQKFKDNLATTNPKLHAALVAINKSIHGDAGEFTGVREKPQDLLASAQRGLDKALANYETAMQEALAAKNAPKEPTENEQTKERLYAMKAKSKIIKAFGLDSFYVDKFQYKKDPNGGEQSDPIEATFRYNGHMAVVQDFNDFAKARLKITSFLLREKV